MFRSAPPERRPLYSFWPFHPARTIHSQWQEREIKRRWNPKLLHTKHIQRNKIVAQLAFPRKVPEVTETSRSEFEHFIPTFNLLSTFQKWNQLLCALWAPESPASSQVRAPRTLTFCSSVRSAPRTHGSHSESLTDGRDDRWSECIWGFLNGPHTQQGNLCILSKKPRYEISVTQ